MRSRTDARLRVVAMASLVAVARRRCGASARQAPVTANTDPRDRLRSPGARNRQGRPKPGNRTHDQELRWKDSTERRRVRPPGVARMDRRHVRWFERSARVLMWCGVGGAGRHCSSSSSFALARLWSAATRETRSSLRLTCGIWTSVRNPSRDIGAAARVLWDRGDHRAALALLYRGMLSRLAHVHRIPIRDSSTEGDCLALAASHLTARTRILPRGSYVCGSAPCTAGRCPGGDRARAV